MTEMVQCVVNGEFSREDSCVCVGEHIVSRGDSDCVGNTWEACGGVFLETGGEVGV